MVEKPLGVNLAQVREVVDAARAANVPVTVYLQRRFDPAHHAGGHVSHLDVCTLVAQPGPRMRLIGSADTWVYDDFDDLGKTRSFYPDLDDAPGGCGWLYGGPEREPAPTRAQDWAEFYSMFFHAMRSPDTFKSCRCQPRKCCTSPPYWTPPSTAAPPARSSKCTRHGLVDEWSHLRESNP